jgi:hypothetical protein
MDMLVLIIVDFGDLSKTVMDSQVFVQKCDLYVVQPVNKQAINSTLLIP